MNENCWSQEDDSEFDGKSTRRKDNSVNIVVEKNTGKLCSRRQLRTCGGLVEPDVR